MKEHMLSYLMNHSRSEIDDKIIVEFINEYYKYLKDLDIELNYQMKELGDMKVWQI